MAAKLCRGVCDQFFESSYENKNGCDNKQRCGHLERRQMLSFVVLKNGIHWFMEKRSCVTAIGFVGINGSRGSKYTISERLRLQR